MEHLASGALLLIPAVLLFLARWHDRRKLEWSGNDLLCGGCLCLAAVFLPTPFVILYSILPGSLLFAWGTWRYTREIRRRLEEWKSGSPCKMQARESPGSSVAQ